MATIPGVIPFPRPERARLPAAMLPLPIGEAPRPSAEVPQALDLKGRPKAIFLIGRGRIGKTTFARWLYETTVLRGGAAVVAAADPGNRSLRAFLNDVVEPPSPDPDDARDWLRDLLLYVKEERQSALIDLGGGNTSLSALLREMPDLADVLEAGGIEPVALHVLGPDPHDLVPLAMLEVEGFRPRATALVLNEVHGKRSGFAEVMEHDVVRAAVGRGAVQIWMPRLTPDAARKCDAFAWRYHDVAGVADAFTASSVQTWLRRMGEACAPIATWLPE